jgi:hypothetical protein
LKTGMYYLRTKAAVDALAGLGMDVAKYQTTKETVAPQVEVKTVQEEPNAELAALADQTMSDLNCSLDNPDDCLACGS